MMSPVLHHVLLALDPDLALVAAGLFGTQRHIVVVLDDFGTDEAPLEIGVDDTGGLGRFHAPAESPGTALVGTGREKTSANPAIYRPL